VVILFIAKVKPRINFAIKKTNNKMYINLANFENAKNDARIGQPSSG